MDPIIRAGTFKVTIGGVEFVLRRRCTAVMAEARGFMAVVGQIAADPQSAYKVDEKAAVKLGESILRAAMVLPVLRDETVEGFQYTYKDLAPFADALLAAFMDSGLQVDPTAPSCTGSEARN
jgi:hypothetical protein